MMSKLLAVVHTISSIPHQPLPQLILEAIT